mmetsp:Transcript_63122/g.133252  ORF Transcript_63122/g.133252 Transcript_63122/m.133252 type:complete len:248 (+) Transcript_63122:61-804(+)|eukprot:CAMPEP_0206525498 /NCGR_PEP_ID=MMETSP0325_2-20121206/8_1 /ASSEMBLY_ACC=CAM_ASM_000347 /TAXON_ID=2866 /ORGANISM="Crypthecodinium cohnii, Strain Seligo" /LENGTH=247 /DNA_ID=CAMNT_0054020167 /DNA_START=35 /DNA_END=778 /DNA_ORIENTATION=+
MARRFGVRAIVQIVLTGMTLVTSVLAFVWAFYFEQFMDEMTTNYKGELTTTFLPCLRSTLDTCENSNQDECYTYCCPSGYYCSISPLVGLYCQDGTNACTDHNWCRDFADIPGTCATTICQAHETVLRVLAWSFILSAVGIVLDVVDIISMLTVPDAVVMKSGANVLSCLIKFIAFAAIIGAGSWAFLAELTEAECFNSDGMNLVGAASGAYLLYCVLQCVSACLSLCLAPLSAYYGGKIYGVPYVK